MKTKIPLPECDGVFIEFDDAKISERLKEKFIEAFDSIEFRLIIKGILREESE